MIELVSSLIMRIRRWDGDEPMRDPLGRDPAPMIAVSGLILALSATLRSKVWWRWAMGSNVELRLVSESKADTVWCSGPRSVWTLGGGGKGSEGVSGGERIELDTLPP